MTRGFCRFTRIALIIFLFSTTVTLYAWTLPWAGFSLDSGATDNLFADSLKIEDLYSTVSLDLEQPVTPLFSIFYYGSLSAYSENKDLGSFYNNGGLNFWTSYKNLESIWLSAGGLNLAYNEDYSIYDKQRLYISAGGLHRTSNTLRLRSMLNYSGTTYSSYSDSLSVDYSELLINCGANLSFSLPLAVDAEAGYQRREYSKFENQTNTSFAYLQLRVSRPIGTRTGIKFVTNIRNQISTEYQELYSLYTNGIDPSDLLWDGYQGKIGITHLFGQWRSSMNILYRKATFVESYIITGRQQRNDELFDFTVLTKRVLNLKNQPFQIWLILDYSLEVNQSSDSYNDYTSNIFHIGFSINSF
jgi:hypothetical protein